MVVGHQHALDDAVFLELRLQAEAGAGEIRALVAVDALAFSDEQLQAADLLRREGGQIRRSRGVTDELVERCLVGDERGFVEHHREAPEHREVRFHLGEAVSGPPCGVVPVFIVERLLDEPLVVVDGLQAVAQVRIGSEHAVRLVDFLIVQGTRNSEELAADQGDRASFAGHFHRAQQRTDGL